MERFDFLYGEKSFLSLSPETNTEQKAEETVTTYTMGNLRITHRERRYEEFAALEWVNVFENIGSEDTEILSNLWDAIGRFSLKEDPAPLRAAYIPRKEFEVILHAPAGSDLSVKEFYANTDYLQNDFASPYHLQKGKTYTYSANGGRSSDARAPFFHLRQGDRGLFFAIGWTGQWKMEITRGKDAVTWKTGLENAHFRLLPEEKIRTSSVLVMSYEGSEAEGHNRFRRLLKQHFCPLGKGGRPQYAPLSAQLWGGMTSEVMKSRIAKLQEYQIPAEYVWIDAGWYGDYEKPCIDEFEGDWGRCTGDWQVNFHIHPRRLLDVAKTARDAGMKLLLWFEPERAHPETPLVKAHPEWFFLSTQGGHALLNLGHPEAWQYAFDTISDLIEKLDISCYRQDFNMYPYGYWKRGDRPREDRQGISEIRHIMGLYRLWDALMERFPHLLIDNCASGGKRIDIETLRRSVPLWRSDRMCQANYPEIVTQTHNTTFSLWMPYSGTSTGRKFDSYRIRSAYAGGMTLNYTYTEYDPFGEDPLEMGELKRYCEEYLRARSFFSEDMYMLTAPSDSEDVWSAVQFHRPETGEGILQIFRRENAPYEKASYPLGGLEADRRYAFEDADAGETVFFDGKLLTKTGFPAELLEKRTAKLWFYRPVFET